MRSNDLHLRKSCTPAQSLQQLWLNAILLQELDNENAFRPLFYMTLPLIIVLEIHKNLNSRKKSPLNTLPIIFSEECSQLKTLGSLALSNASSLASPLPLLL